MKNLSLKLAAALLAGTCVVALAQSPSRPGAAGAQANDVSLPATAGTVGTGPIVMPPAPPKPGASPARARGDFTIHTHHLIYVTLPGSLERPMYPNGDGIVVLDAENNYAFVKRIHVWNYAGSMTPEDISGVAASPATNMLYLSARGRLGAIDLATDKMVWTTTLDGKCCERPQVSADGKTLVVGSNLQDYWYKLDAKTGKLLATIHAPGSPSAHNLNLSADGKLAFMSPNGKLLQIADIETAKVIRTIRFPENIRVQVLNKDSSRIYVNQNNFLGYIVADTKTGKILNTVEVTSVDWRSVWNKSPRPRVPHGCPSHGIAITPDGKEVWLADALFNKIHIFSNTDNPKEIATIDTPDGVFWMTFGLDGKLVYASSGDIIDVATRKIVGATKSEFGTRMFSEKELDMTFLDGHLQRVSNQFGNEYGDFVTAEKMGVGPHMTPLPGKADTLATPTGVDPNAGMPQAAGVQ
ncbi:MAG TPA: PQQ-binding-like beta-propeller repeat protein [Rhizomicrobium sp.]|nr:PQQ-binding-like beta-propeller repeat protein [Rhizomicrobium sp.]